MIVGQLYMISSLLAGLRLKKGRRGEKLRQVQRMGGGPFEEGLVGGRFIILS
jgi:hypothetical protein